MASSKKQSDEKVADTPVEGENTTPEPEKAPESVETAPAPPEPDETPKEAPDASESVEDAPVSDDEIVDEDVDAKVQRILGAVSSHTREVIATELESGESPTLNGLIENN